MSEFSELVVRYGARFGRLTRGVRVVELDGPGGGLSDAVDRLGVTPLASGLLDGDCLSMADSSVSLKLERSGAVVVLSVNWEGGPSLVEELSVAEGAPLSLPTLPGALGSVLFLPDPTSLLTDLRAALHEPSQPLYITGSGIWTRGRIGEGEALLATIPAVNPADLGASSFCETYGVTAPYISGAMAGGIASAEMVIAMGQAGLMGFFGSGGLSLPAIEAGVKAIKASIPGKAAGFNLLHNPAEPMVEEATVDLYLANDCRIVSASAYMTLTPALVRYRLTGIHRGAGGQIVCHNRVFAKISRPEVAERFMRPAPENILKRLVERGQLTTEEAELARHVPIAEDITVEADSGGHTDRRPLVVLLPTMSRLRDRIVAEMGYDGIEIRVGAAGGLGDPASIHAAFCMGAAYVLTGSINQSCVEAGTSRLVREMISEAGIADVATGPAPDMFEIGAHVQVLSRGSLYAQRASRLYRIYKEFDGMDAIPEVERSRLERTIFRRPLAEVWTETAEYWGQRDPRELEKARRDSRHQMALTFRWYLGMTSRWARLGDESRKRDFQIWCGPSMGLFNDWIAGSHLVDLDTRRVTDVADSLLRGAAGLRRVILARTLLAGKVLLPPGLEDVRPSKG
ncbi:MAG: trans-AT polyketide synthase/acyltransferase/oxidoreductase domain-containing protein [Myxococcota bacterium]|jgi:trans-AT polyketide synthase/acyltransferase/oxidoreductase domain-containing protein